MHRLARRYERIDNAIDTEDLVQAGYMGLVEAERTYDASRGKSWAGWAAWYIIKAMREAVGINTTRERAHLHTVSLDAPLGDEDDDATLMDKLEDESIPDASSGLIKAEKTAAVREALDRLDADKREAIRRHDLQGACYEAIGEALGLTASAVKNLRAKALRDLRRDWKLRRQLDEETPYYHHVGLSRFNATWTSATEAAALWRIEHRASTS